MAILSHKIPGQNEVNRMILFETLTQSAIISATRDVHLKNSILWHLSQLFNTRQGTLQHMPDYGLPDIHEIYRGLPQSIHYLLQEMVNVIEKYEPRIQHIKITEHQTNRENDKLYIKILAETDNGLMDFATYIDSTGYIKIEPLVP